MNTKKSHNKHILSRFLHVTRWLRSSMIRDERLSLCLFNQDSPTNVTVSPLVSPVSRLDVPSRFRIQWIEGIVYTISILPFISTVGEKGGDEGLSDLYINHFNFVTLL